MVKRIAADAIPGVEVLPYWQAKYYTPNVLTSVRAIVWHFAQGGGTDTWLTRADGKQGRNSCHIVIKYGGDIRQLVELDDASWSLHIDWSGTYGNFGIFSPEAAKDALGAGYADPNKHIIAIEIEGFWDQGPDAGQAKTIILLARYLERLFPAAVHLGHRDFQDYKACPGPSLFRGLLPHGGRLTAGAGDSMDYDTRTTILPFGGRFTIPANAAITGIQLGPTGVSATKLWTPRPTPSSADYDAVVSTNKTRGNPFIHVTNGFFEGWLLSSGLVLAVPNPAPQPTGGGGITQAELEAEIAKAVEAATAPLKAALDAERQDDSAIATMLRNAADTLSAA